jgi:hypothetical protein
MTHPVKPGRRQNACMVAINRFDGGITDLRLAAPVTAL